MLFPNCRYPKTYHKPFYCAYSIFISKKLITKTLYSKSNAEANLVVLTLQAFLGLWFNCWTKLFLHVFFPFVRTKRSRIRATNSPCASLRSSLKSKRPNSKRQTKQWSAWTNWCELLYIPFSIPCWSILKSESTQTNLDKHFSHIPGVWRQLHII